MADSRKLDGHYMETCNCKPTSPCIFLSPPTEGDCTVLVGAHIVARTMGPVDLAVRRDVIAAAAGCLFQPWAIPHLRQGSRRSFMVRIEASNPALPRLDRFHSCVTSRVSRNELNQR